MVGRQEAGGVADTAGFVLKRRLPNLPPSSTTIQLKMSSSVRLLLRPQQALKQVRWKSTTAVPPTGTFRPLHPLRGGAGIQHTPPMGKRSLSAFGNKFADYTQRGIVTCLFGLTIWGMYAMYDVHQHIMAKAQGISPIPLSARTAMLTNISSQRCDCAGTREDLAESDRYAVPGVREAPAGGTSCKFLPSIHRTFTHSQTSRRKKFRHRNQSGCWLRQCKDQRKVNSLLPQHRPILDLMPKLACECKTVPFYSI